MRVLFISPSYPPEMPYFVRGLAEVGAEVIGIGDSPAGALPEMTRNALSDYLQVGSLWDEQGMIDTVRAWPGARGIDRVECLWEPGMLLAAGLREALGLPGMTVEQTVPFRDKEVMKQVLDRAGLRTPRHRSAKSANDSSPSRRTRCKCSDAVKVSIFSIRMATAGSRSSRCTRMRRNTSSPVSPIPVNGYWNMPVYGLTS